MLDRVQIGVLKESPVLETLDKGGDGAALFPDLDLGLVAVEFGVEHGVGPEAIGTTLEEVWPLASTHGGDRPLRCRLHGEHVHAVDGGRRHRVAGRLLCQVGDGLGQGQRRAHSV